MKTQISLLIVVLLTGGFAYANYDVCEIRAQNSIIDFYLTHKAEVGVGMQSSKLISKSGNQSVYEIIVREINFEDVETLRKFRVPTVITESGNCVAGAPVTVTPYSL